MYLPKVFDVADRADCVALMRAHPFAALIAVKPDGELEITHSPLLVLDDGRIEGHIARANPLAPLVESGARLTAVFQGPHAYVSPRLYKNADNVPTWNYAVVHAIGRPRLLTEAGVVMRHLHEMTARYERTASEPWVPERAGELPQKLLPALVAFELVVEKLEAKFKLSQNRKPEDRAGVLDAFERGTAEERAVAELMKRHGPPR